jgi:phthiocerol/phenolphthiocerol synthesis type-I polyketide synthase E
MDTLGRSIAALWEETFAIDNVKLDDNFFELGGNSVLAMEITDRISERLDLQISALTLFQNPTPRELARCLATTEQGEAG